LIDKQAVVNNYLKTVQQLHRLPCISDDEMVQLFGTEVNGIIAYLSQYAAENLLCVNCPKRCCLVAQCELYDTQFQMCPIFDLRPVVCRMHYCHLFQKECRQLVEGLSDIFFDCILKAEAAGIPHAKLFDSPPIARCAPEFVKMTETIMQSVKDGMINPKEAALKIRIEAGNHRL